MRGAIIKRHARSCPCRAHGMRSKCLHCRRCSCRSWSIVIDRGYVTQADGTRRRKQQWVTISGTRAEAEARRAEMVRDANRGVLVINTRLTLTEWLDRWLHTISVARRESTIRQYRSIIGAHLKPALGSLRLAAVTPLDLESYYATKGHLSRTTLQMHHAVLSAAFGAAVRANIISRNPASLVTGKPKPNRDPEVIRAKCLSGQEARRLLEVAQEAGPQWGALIALALDTGARRNELLGLRWGDIALDSDTPSATISRQLIDHRGPSPRFGPTKNGAARTITLAPGTVTLLLQHRRAQAECIMRNRHHYRTDLDLVFARTFDEGATSSTLGLPLSRDILTRRFHRLREQAGLPTSFTFHGLRHTSATLELASGAPLKAVSERLGHRKTATTDIYTHVLPEMAQDAARRRGAVLYGAC